MVKNNQKKKLYLVGDKMKDFSNHINVFTVSEFEQLTVSALKCDSIKTYDVQVGQGVCELKLNRLRTRLIESGLENIFYLHTQDLYKKCTPAMTHKRKHENILISEPNELNDTTYQAFLMVADECAEMSDHVTGKHIQGMVLIEAARQMVISVAEKYHILPTPKNKSSFITHSIKTQFYQFLFPLTISIQYKIIEMRKASSNNFTSTAIIQFIQTGIVATEVTFNFSVLDGNFIAEKENNLANSCIEYHLDNHHA